MDEQLKQIQEVHTELTTGNENQIYSDRTPYEF